MSNNESRSSTVSVDQEAPVDQEAFRLFQEGKFEEALVAYDQMLVDNRKDHYAVKGRAVTLLKLGRAKEAKDYLREHCEHAPKDNVLATAYASVLNYVGEHEEAIEVLEKFDGVIFRLGEDAKLNRARSEMSALCVQYGRALRAVGEIKKAKKILQAAADVGDVVASKELAYIFMKERNPKSIIELLEPFKEVSDPQTNFVLGWAYLIAGHFQKALPCLKPLADQGDWLAIRELSNLYKKTGERDKFEECIERRVAISRGLNEPVGGEKTVMIGEHITKDAQTLYKMGRVEEAEELFRKALKYDSDNEFAVTGLAKILLDDKRDMVSLSEAKKLLEDYLRIDSKNEFVIKKLLAVLKAMRNYEGAINLLMPMAESGDAEAIFSVAMCYREAGDCARALEIMEMLDKQIRADMRDLLKRGKQGGELYAEKYSLAERIKEKIMIFKKTLSGK